jgi:prepilin-type N-terminal cleavage/methylation domain-containing protein
MRKNGFTLIELIMVISIIAALAGLLIPIITIAKTASKNAKCTAQLGTIKASLSLYKDANGFYPEQYVVTADDLKPKNPNKFTDNPQKRLEEGGEIFSLFFTTGSGTPTTYRMADDLTSNDWTNVAEALLKQLQTVDRGSYVNMNALRDPFTGGGTTSKVFRYRPAKFYPFKAHSARLIDSEEDTNSQTPSPPPPNPDSYQLWSAGPDGTDQFGDRDGPKSKVNGRNTGRKNDDLANWTIP